MRLLDVRTLLERELHQSTKEIKLELLESTPYAIVSHTWDEPEVKYDDILAVNKLGGSLRDDKCVSATRLENACKKVLDYQAVPLKHLWLDTICIDQRNPFEVSIAVNSMFEWYKEAEVCFAYLSDYPSPCIESFVQSRWFSRGWTLQELVAPKIVLFFTKNWELIGDKPTFEAEIQRRTSIAGNYLLQTESISRASISQRMSWASTRETSEPEDIAYCLLGLFGVNMPLLYGEGKVRAFRRLQEEIIKYSDDHTIFAWKSTAMSKTTTGLLADSPQCFQNAGHYIHWPSRNDTPFQLTNKGVSIQLPIQKIQGSELYVASIDCRLDANHYLAMYLEQTSANSQQFHRVFAHELVKAKRGARGNSAWIYIKAPA